MRRLLLISAALTVLSSCAGGVGWVNPDLPKSQAQGDYAACRRYADGELGSYNYTPPGMEGSTNPTHMMDDYDNRKQFDVLVSRCMRAKGYYPKK